MMTSEALSQVEILSIPLLNANDSVFFFSNLISRRKIPEVSEILSNLIAFFTCCSDEI